MGEQQIAGRAAEALGRLRESRPRQSWGRAWRAARTFR
jgi:hypothetical protein